MLSVSDGILWGIPASHSGNKIKDSIFKTAGFCGFLLTSKEENINYPRK